MQVIHIIRGFVINAQAALVVYETVYCNIVMAAGWSGTI